ncbi:MAG: NACHT domain-containing protein [Timaviella obliquedivisa GSE-PSE-MK23-08B]|jgi:hypothetical protein|nr:NACHT domain-containing protein [Timaviella obliquedivisa GSE-PSE-MK23-08B]
MTASPEFADYLNAIAVTYAQWWELYTLMDAVGQEQVKRQTEKCAFPFDFGLMVQTAKPEEEKAKGELPENLGENPEEKLERLPVLEGMRKYAAEHVLLVGRPGSGKSTALIRLLLEEAGNQDGAAKIPVLVELRYWQTGVIDRILTVLQQGNCLDLDAETLKSWLRQGRLLLLMDGLNELPSEEARRNMATFRRDYLQTPMIFTTRDLSVGGDLGIAKKLEIQPLTETQMQEFVRAYLSQNQAEQMLRQIKDRLRDLGQTPLLLWMLCGLFQQLGTVPPNLGMVFRQFTQGYERSLKEDIPVTAESRRWWSLLLQRLAFVMMRGENPQEKPTELQVAITRQTAEEILTQYLTAEKFDKPRDFAKQWLEDLLKHHLIQMNGDKIEFRHQLIQEYYAAEYLLRQLPKLSDAELQRQYLNYLKWTEPIALMLVLVEDEAQAVRVVELALTVDLRLGAQLAGEVRWRFRDKTILLLSNLDAIPSLRKVLRSIADKEIQALERLTNYVPSRNQEYVSGYADYLLATTILDEKSILHRALSPCLPDALRLDAVRALKRIASEKVLCILEQALNEDHVLISQESAQVLQELETDSSVQMILVRALNSEIPFVRLAAAKALSKIGKPDVVQKLWQLKAYGMNMITVSMEAIASIQARCQFYNYEIFQAAQTAKSTAQNAEDLIHDKLNAIAQGVQKMSEVSKYNFPNAQKVQIFEQVDTYIENNSAISSEDKEAITELQQVIQDLQAKYPKARPEEQSIIIEAEFQEIKQKQPWRWKNLMSYKRLLNGGKTAVVKVGEHFAESSPWGKGAIAFLEGVMENAE